MSEGCRDCLRIELGFLPEEAYPVDKFAEPPVRVYCVDGEVVVPPYKRAVPPQTARFDIIPPTLAASGTFEGNVTSIEWTNDSVYPVTVLTQLSGSLLFVSNAAATEWTFLYGWNLAISSPAVAAGVSNSSVSNYPGLHTVPLGLIDDPRVVDPGASLTITPYMTYTTSGGSPPGAASLPSGGFTIQMFGGPTA